jgi:NADPH2 dehydrogenase
MSYPRISSFKTAGELRAYLTEAGIDLTLDDHLQVGTDAPLAQPYRLASGFTIGNRFCVLPMEGWDGTADGRPSELTFRRWRRFGTSGAKLIWGGEAAAVRHDGRANPNQLLVSEKTLSDLAALREG